MRASVVQPSGEVATQCDVKGWRYMAIIETERLLLRDFAPGDWDALNAIVSDPAVTRYMHFARWDEQKRRQWHARMVEEASRPHPGVDNWAITLRSDGQLIGWLFIGSSSDQGAAGRRGCGWALGHRFWGQGYMTEALRAAIAYEFATLGTRRITAECQPENLASARVMQKCGMTYDGTFYAEDFEGNGAVEQHYSITAPEVGAP
jgi:RimJ/RimL family protein N-acetyltransferase